MFTVGCLRRETGLQLQAWAGGHCFLIMMDLHPVLVLITQEFEGIAYMLLGDAWVNGTIEYSLADGTCDVRYAEYPGAPPLNNRSPARPPIWVFPSLC